MHVHLTPRSYWPIQQNNTCTCMYTRAMCLYTCVDISCVILYSHNVIHVPTNFIYTGNISTCLHRVHSSLYITQNHTDLNKTLGIPINTVHIKINVLLTWWFSSVQQKKVMFILCSTQTWWKCSKMNGNGKRSQVKS